MTPERKTNFDEKVIAERIFRGKKDSYPFSIKEFFVKDRLASHHETMMKQFINESVNKEEIRYATPVMKYDRHGYKSRNRILIVSDQAVYVLNEKDFKVKDKITYSQLKRVMVSSLTDGIFVAIVSTEENGTKGDLILQSDYLIEALTKIVIASNKNDLITIADGDSITHDLSGGKKGTIQFSKGDMYAVKKNKAGTLIVTAPPL